MPDTFITFEKGIVTEVVHLRKDGIVSNYKPHNPYTCKHAYCPSCIWGAFEDEPKQGIDEHEI